jgi:gliding motility-associated-like protein
VSIADDVENIICHGGEVTLSAITNAGPNSSYQWYKGNDAIPGSDAPSYTVLSEGDPTAEKRASYSLTVTDAQGCETSRSNAVEVSVNPLPIAPVVTASGAVCEGGLVTLTASPSGQGSYEWFFEKNGVFESVSAASSVASYRIPSIRPADAGLYRVKVTNKYGCYLEGETRAMVNSLPQAPDITPKGVIRLCTGDSMLLTAYTAGASAGYRHEWWFDNGNSNVNLNVPGDHLYAKQTGTYSARSISDSGCVSADRGLASVEIYYRPVTPIITPDVPVVSICANGATTIIGAAAGATSYQWYTVDQADSYSIIPGSTGSSYAAGESGRYAIRADIAHDDLTCSAFSVPKVMNLFPVPPPPVMAADKTSACAGDVITLTASPGPGSPQPKSYRWYVNGTPQTFAVTDTLFATRVEAATYKVAIISADNCESDASTPKEIIIRARPTVSIDDGVRETCGGTVRLSATMNPPNTAGSYEWWENDTVYIPEASTSPILVQSSANPLIGKKATYYLYATDKYGCRSADPSNKVEVNIRALPPNPVATVDLANGVCEGSSTTLRVSPSGAGTYRWFHARDGRSFDSVAITSDTVLRVLNAQTSDAGLYAVEITNAWGCTAALRGEAELNVLGLPRVYFTATRACENDTEFSAVEPDGGLFSGWGCTPDGRFVPADVHQGEAVVTYAYTAPNGCANHDTKNIEIIRLPNTPTVTAAGPTEVCPGDISVALQTSVAVIADDEYNTSYSYQWYKDGFPIPGEVALTYVATKEGSYAVRVCNQNLCWAINPSAPVAVSYLPTPAPPVIASQSAFFCPGSLVELFVQSEDRGIFQWYKGDGKQMEEVLGEIADTYLVGEAGQYAVDYIGETGCRSAISNSLTITEYPMPKQPEIVPSQANLYAGLDYKLLVKFPEEGEQYGWYKNTLYANVEAPAFPIANLSSVDTGSYMVKAVNPQGCDLWSEPYVLKLAKAELFVPNIFTPNGDGVNDYFQILGLDDFTENKLEVLNKYGKIIFSQKNYHNTWSGEGLPSDVYYYTLELKRLDGATSVLNGFVHLRR